MGKIFFTKHALDRLRQRKIRRHLVEITVRFPHKMRIAGDKFYAFKKVGKNYLKVIFVRVGDDIIIITQYFTDSLL